MHHALAHLTTRFCLTSLLTCNSVGSDDGETLDTATATGGKPAAAATPAAGAAATTDASGLTDEGLVERLLQRLQVRVRDCGSATSYRNGMLPKQHLAPVEAPCERLQPTAPLCHLAFKLADRTWTPCTVFIALAYACSRSPHAPMPKELDTSRTERMSQLTEGLLGDAAATVNNATAGSVLLGGRAAGAVGGNGVLGLRTGAAAAAANPAAATAAAVPVDGSGGMFEASTAAAANRTAAAAAATAVIPAAADAIRPQWRIGNLTLASEDSDGLVSDFLTALSEVVSALRPFSCSC